MESVSNFILVTVAAIAIAFAVFTLGGLPFLIIAKAIAQVISL